MPLCAAAEKNCRAKWKILWTYVYFLGQIRDCWNWIRKRWIAMRLILGIQRN